VAIAAPKANILDEATMRGLSTAVSRAADAHETKAVLLVGEGPNFSFGASVEEHLPDRVESMLATFHELFRTLIGSRLVFLAVVRGQCLGGGLELAAFCHRVFAAPDAKLGKPEIRLGVFAPVASLVLPPRVGQRLADDMLLSGRTLDADEALAGGLVDEVALDPEDAARAWFRSALAAHSAASLRCAVHAARLDFNACFSTGIEELERHYLDQLMACSDAKEGIRSFLEKRKPAWRHA
jgi:cyclohexa-1,5-dienecarbonyl-CoA hydratase